MSVEAQLAHLGVEVSKPRPAFTGPVVEVVKTALQMFRMQRKLYRVLWIRIASLESRPIASSLIAEVLITVVRHAVEQSTIGLEQYRVFVRDNRNYGMDND